MEPEGMLDAAAEELRIELGALDEGRADWRKAGRRLTRDRARKVLRRLAARLQERLKALTEDVRHDKRDETTTDCRGSGCIAGRLQVDVLAVAQSGQGAVTRPVERPSGPVARR